MPTSLIRWITIAMICTASTPRSMAQNSATAATKDERLGELLGERGDFSLQPSPTPEEWRQRADRVRSILNVTLGLWPPPTRTPLNPIVHGRREFDDYTIEKVILESAPGFYLTGNLYRPHPSVLDQKHPAILSPHGHFPGGRFIDEGVATVRRKIAAGAERFVNGGRSFMQSRCVQLARMGCVVFHYDMIGYGDSVQIPLEVVHRFSRLRSRFKRLSQNGFYSARAEQHLFNPMGLHVWNSQRALDFLADLPDVDPNRIAVTGGSGGGTQTFMLCAVDDRPLVSVPVVILSTKRQGGCTCENVSGLRWGSYNLEFAALHAPKPQLLIPLQNPCDRKKYIACFLSGMSLPDFTPQRSLFEPDHQFSELFENSPSADRFRFFAGHVLPQIQAMRPQLQEAYCLNNGRPGEEPVRLLGVLLLQFMERLPDRQAVECCQFDLRWKTALGMEVNDLAFHATVLVRFRQRLVDHGLEKLAFDACLDAMRVAGYLGKKTKRQRLDSTHVIGLVSRMSRLENVRETFRLALEALESVSSLARDSRWTIWWERYVENKPDFRVNKTELNRRFDQAGIDIHHCLKWLDSLESKAPALAAVNLLRKVFEENFEVKESGHTEQRRAQPPGAVHNPHDPDAHWSSKDTIRNKEWVGYKAQIAETVTEEKCATGEPTTNVLTEISTQDAIASDKAALPEVEQQWEDRNLEVPEELYVDGGYTSGKELARAEKENRKLNGPMAPAPKKENRFAADDFDVSVEERIAECPGKRTNTQCSRLTEKKSGKVSFRFEFSRKHCQACSLKSQCLGKDQRYRTLTVSEHHTLMQARRLEQKTEAFKKDMHARNGIEATISELARGHGLRRSRYRGLAKTRLQNYLIGAACNLRRWSARIAWEEKVVAC